MELRRHPAFLIGTYSGHFQEEEAENYLTTREREKMERISTPERRSEWLTGRIVAKKTILLKDVENMLDRAQLEIDVDDWGNPFCRGISRPTWPLSISHSRGLTACALPTVDWKTKIGMDVHDFNTDLGIPVERFTCPEERERLDQSESPALVHALLWSFKEAAIKLMGGRTARRRVFKVFLDLHRQRARILFQDGASGVNPEKPKDLEGAFRIIKKEHVLTWVSGSVRPGSAVLHEFKRDIAYEKI